VRPSVAATVREHIRCPPQGSDGHPPSQQTRGVPKQGTLAVRVMVMRGVGPGAGYLRPTVQGHAPRSRMLLPWEQERRREEQPAVHSARRSRSHYAPSAYARRIATVQGTASYALTPRENARYGRAEASLCEVAASRCTLHWTLSPQHAHRTLCSDSRRQN